MDLVRSKAFDTTHLIVDPTADRYICCKGLTSSLLVGMVRGISLSIRAFQKRGFEVFNECNVTYVGNIMGLAAGFGSLKVELFDVLRGSSGNGCFVGLKQYISYFSSTSS